MKELSILITLTLGKQTRQRPLFDACLVHPFLLQGSSSLRLRVAPRLRQLRRLVPLNAESAVVEVDPVALVVESAVALFDVALVFESANNVNTSFTMVVVTWTGIRSWLLLEKKFLMLFTTDDDMTKWWLWWFKQSMAPRNQPPIDVATQYANRSHQTMAAAVMHIDADEDWLPNMVGSLNPEKGVVATTIWLKLRRAWGTIWGFMAFRLYFFRRFMRGLVPENFALREMVEIHHVNLRSSKKKAATLTWLEAL